MRSVSVEEARERLDELLDEVERGGEVVITRGGALVARVTAVQHPTLPLDLDALRAFRETLPAQDMSAGEFVRWMRDTDRY